MVPNRFTSDKRIVIHCNPYIITFPTRFNALNTNSIQIIIDHSFRPDRQGRSFRMPIATSARRTCVVTRTRGTVIVTLYSSIVFTRTNWGKVDLHQWITAVNMDCPPSGIHGIACRKYNAPPDLYTCFAFRGVLFLFDRWIDIIISFKITPLALGHRMEPVSLEQPWCINRPPRLQQSRHCVASYTQR